MDTPYMTSVAARRERLLPDLVRCIAKHGATVVGDGFIDIIVRRHQWESFIGVVSDAGVAIHLVTLWCDCTPENSVNFGCPHGYGGPGHAGGYFSEIAETDSYEITDPQIDPRQSLHPPADVVRRCNGLVLEFCWTGMRAREDYSPCLLPGFWLAVPDDWRRV